ncbi:MAG: alkaline phytoceramidase [Alphaproteobacteria bacterium]
MCSQRVTPLTYLRSLDPAIRIAAVAAAFLLALAVALAIPPVPQPLAYHRFADDRVWLGISHAGDVITNLGFLAAGIFGLTVVSSRKYRAALAGNWEGVTYQVFFLGVALTAFGSAYYHLDPSNSTLLWDRLAMTMAFMALLCAVIADRIDVKAAAVVLAPLIAAAAAALLYWHLGEQLGHGNLNLYFAIQYFPALGIPLICLLFRDRHGTGRTLWMTLGWFALAMVLEKLDHGIYALLGGAISGHGLKHLAAAMAALTVAAMVRARGSGSG